MAEQTREIAKMFCGKCEEEREFRREWRDSKLIIRGEEITAKMPLLVCSVCGDEQPEREPELDSMRPFYDEFRRRHGMLTSGQITGIREKYGLSREAFAAVLGMSPATLYRYETGALQDQVHDSLIYACATPRIMAKLVERRRGLLSELQHKRFLEAVSKLAEEQAKTQVDELQRDWQQSIQPVQRAISESSLAQCAFQFSDERVAQKRLIGEGWKGLLLLLADTMSFGIWGRTISGWLPGQTRLHPSSMHISTAIHPLRRRVCDGDVAPVTVYIPQGPVDIAVPEDQQELIDAQVRLCAALSEWAASCANPQELQDRVRHHLLLQVRRHLMASVTRGRSPARYTMLFSSSIAGDVPSTLDELPEAHSRIAGRLGSQHFEASNI